MGADIRHYPADQLNIDQIPVVETDRVGRLALLIQFVYSLGLDSESSSLWYEIRSLGQWDFGLAYAGEEQLIYSSIYCVCMFQVDMKERRVVGIIKEVVNVTCNYANQINE